MTGTYIVYSSKTIYIDEVSSRKKGDKQFIFITKSLLKVFWQKWSSKLPHGDKQLID